MELIFSLPLLISAISLLVSIITIWLTKFDGPDLTLLNPPEELKLSNQGFNNAQTQNYTPRWFSLEPIHLLFANHGGKAGTILNWKLVFVPNSQFEPFFEELTEHNPDLAATIEKGDNNHFTLTPNIRTIKWKRTALVDLLNQKGDAAVDELVTLALEQSKKEFKKFCDFMEKPGELGKVSFVATMTVGRFRTSVKEKTLFENLAVQKRTDDTVLSLRSCLSRWAMRDPNKVQLMNELRNPIKGIMEELERNLSPTLSTEIEESNISHNLNECKVRVNAWKQLQQERYQPEKRIRWFFIQREKGLKQNLTELYINLETYNSHIDELASVGKQRNKEHFQRINAERELLVEKVQKMIIHLSGLVAQIFEEELQASK